MIKLKTKQKKHCEQQSIENDVSKFIAVSTKKKIAFPLPITHFSLLFQAK
jgi:hypothetical protein